MIVIMILSGSFIWLQYPSRSEIVCALRLACRS